MIYDFGERLRRILRLKDMHQKTLARSMYLSESAVSQYIHGSKAQYSRGYLDAMQEVVDILNEKLEELRNDD